MGGRNFSQVKTIVYRGIEPIEVVVEVDITSGLPAFNIVGLPEAAVKESRERVRSAIVHSGFSFPRRRITVNLAPADVKKEGTALDFPIAVGILTASGYVNQEALNNLYLVGELSLTGELRGVRGVLIYSEMVREKNGVLCVPEVNLPEARLVKGVRVLPAHSLGEFAGFLEKGTDEFIMSGDGVGQEDFSSYNVDFAEVKGQSFAKRAIEVAVAGMHNLLMIGPPGTGKTMLAQRIPTIMPPMSERECLETTKIYSVAGLLTSEHSIITRRPFRSPHHTISDAGLAGGGQFPRPGEISLAHNGVLFLDEMPEFKRNVLEILRQPLEEGKVVISRAGHTITYPARFMLAGAMNPCPCGYYGHPEKECVCSYQQVTKYRMRLSGPLLDRIDIQVKVSDISYDDWTGGRSPEGEKSAQIRERVMRAMLIQKQRLGPGRFNAHMSEKELRAYAILDSGADSLLKSASLKYHLSARSLSRVLKVARTIADLDGSSRIQSNHIAEALQYRLSAVEDEVLSS